MTSEPTSSAPERARLPQPLAGSRSDWSCIAAGTAIVVLAVFGVYWPALRGQFLWDDFLVVHRNPLVTGELGLASIWFRTDFPLTHVAFWLEWLALGDHPLGYHVVSVLLHATSAALLWRVLAQLRIPAPWLAAMIFAVHPVCVTSVAWISELKNTLSLPFYLLSLSWYLRSCPAPPAHAIVGDDVRSLTLGPTERSEPPYVVSYNAPRWYWLSLGAFVLALLSKTSTVMLPAVLLACAWWQRGRVTWRDVRRASPFFAQALAFGLMSIWFQAHGAITGATVQTENFWGRLAGAGMALWFYLGKALLPLNLNMIYPRWQIEAGAAISYVPLVLWCAVLAACWLLRRTWARHVLFGLACFTVTLFPVLGFFDMFFLTMSRVSDHFAYLPLVALVALAAGALGHVLKCGCPKQNHGSTRMDTDSGSSATGARTFLSASVADSKLRRTRMSALRSYLCSSGSICGCSAWLRLRGKALWCLGGAWVVGLAVLSMFRAQVFVSEEVLWRDTLAKNSAAWCAHANLGWILAEQQKYDEARTHLEASLAIRPANAQARSNLGRLLSLQGKFPEADAQFQAALKLKPTDADIRKSYASALAEQGRKAEAVEVLREALRLGPKPELRLQLATLLHETGRLRDTVAEYRQVLAANPDEPEALNNLAGLLATCPDATLRDGAEAVRLAERACRLSGNRDARTLGTLAAAYAESGRFNEAVTTAQKAIQLATASGDNRLAGICQQLLKLYRAGKPYHERAAAPVRPEPQ